jgi:hypothetical protein
LAAEESLAQKEEGDVSTAAPKSVRHACYRLHAPDQTVQARRRGERTRPGQHLGPLAGLVGVLATATVAALVAGWRFAKDVTA